MSQILWYGHSAFNISCDDKHVVVDPFLTPASGTTAETIGPVDVVLVTHDHADHVGDAVAICKNTGAMLGAIVGTAQKLEAAGVPSAQLLNYIGFNMGGTAGYIIRTPDGKHIYHAGDTCIFAGMELWGRLYPIDVALLPMGGVFTMDARQAALACKLLGCKQVIPMHWGTFPVLAQDTEAFKAELARVAPGCTCIDLLPGQSVQI